MVKEDKNLTGNARYEGFCIDLLKWIAGQVGFQYSIRLVPDHMYGVYDPETKEWNGIVKELMERVIASYVFIYTSSSIKKVDSRLIFIYDPLFSPFYLYFINRLRSPFIPKLFHLRHSSPKRFFFCK